MPKKTNYTPYILGAVAVGGFAAYRFGLFDKLLKKKNTTTETPELPEIEIKKDEPVVKKEINTTPAPDPLKNPVYMNNVRKLQLFLGAGVDGNAGGENSQTNKLTRAKFPQLYASVGRVTPNSIAVYLAEINKKTTTDVSKKEREARVAFGKKLFQLGAQGKRIRPKQTIKNVPVLYFDTARGQYIAGSRKINVVDKHLFSNYEIAGYSYDGFYILKDKRSPKDFIIVNPYSFEAV
jgi:hypothetical protein